MLYPTNILSFSPSSTPFDRRQQSKILLWNYLSLTSVEMIQSCKSNFLQITFSFTNPLQVPWKTLLKLLQLNLYWEGSVSQVHSNTRRLLFGLIKTFHMGGSTLQKLSHPAESSTTFNYFTWKVKCKNLCSKLIPTPHFETVCMNESRGGICREGKFPTYHKLTHHTTKSTKYNQLQSATYCY